MLQQTILAIFFLEQSAKGESSPFSPYLDSLPSDVPHLPIFWSKDEMISNGLNGSNIMIVLDTIRSHLVDSYILGICPVVPEFCDKYTLDHYFWAVGLVRSRAFALKSGDVVVVPLADSLNHRGKASVMWEIELVRHFSSFFRYYLHF